MEHDEAVILEAAMFGGIPEGSGYRHAYAPHDFMQSRGFNPQPAPVAYRPTSPLLETQRLIREQQDDKYLASLQADREKEVKDTEEAEVAREEERQKVEKSLKKLQEEHELETQLAAKEISLHPDIGRQLNPNSYRLVRPYPRRAFCVGESGVTLDQLGLTNKQEALFLELV